MNDLLYYNQGMMEAKGDPCFLSHTVHDKSRETDNSQSWNSQLQGIAKHWEKTNNSAADKGILRRLEYSGYSPGY